MKLNYIELENVRSYLKQRIEFPEFTTLFAGDIGAGKSSVLLAIEFALFGTMRGEVSGTDILRHGKDRGYVKLSFSLNNSDITICRNLKRNSSSVVQEAGWIEIDGVKMHKTPQEIRAYVLKKIGYPMEYIAKNPIIYRYTVYTPQDSMKNIVLEEPDSRLSILRRLFGVEKYSVIKSNAHIIMAEFRAMRREALAFASGLDEKRLLKKKQLQEKQETEKRLFSLKSKLEEVEREVAECESHLQNIQDKIRLLSETARKAAYIEAQLKDRNKRNEKIYSEISDVINDLKELEHIKEPEKSEETESEISEQKHSANEKIRQCISHISVFDSEIRKLRSIVDKGLCEFCGQKVADKNHFTNEIEKILL